jgi:hypothetical protein
VINIEKAWVLQILARLFRLTSYEKRAPTTCAHTNQLPLSEP